MLYKCTYAGQMSTNGDVDDFYFWFESESGDKLCLDYYDLEQVGLFKSRGTIAELAQMAEIQVGKWYEISKDSFNDHI